MKTLFNPNFLRDLRKIKDKTLHERVNAVIESVEEAKSSKDITSLKKIEG